jgi:hypothetical protein
VLVDSAGEVELDAVAGGEEDQLAVGETLLEAMEGIGALLRIERQSLAQFQRCGGVVQSQEQEAVHCWICDLRLSAGSGPTEAICSC